VELDLVLRGPLLLVGFGEEPVRPVVAHVVDEHVDRATRNLGGGGMEFFDGRRLPDVTHDGDGRSPVRLDVGDGGFGQFGIDVVEYHGGTCRGEEAGRASPGAAPTTGHHGRGSRQGDHRCNIR
jgi:hypothetical protein